jgi:hypothetical protein
MKTKTTMLEYCKLVLQSVSFNKQLFKKEYRKAIKWLKQPERLQLKHWIRAEVRPTSLVLRRSKVILIFFMTLSLQHVSSQDMVYEAQVNNASQNFYLAYAGYIKSHASVPITGPANDRLTREAVSHKKKMLSFRHYPGHRQFKWGSVGRIQCIRTKTEDTLSPLVNIQVKRR